MTLDFCTIFVLNIAWAKPKKRAQMCSVLSNLLPSFWLSDSDYSLFWYVADEESQVNEYKQI